MKKIIFLGAILMLPVLVNASSETVYKKNLGYGFKFVQTNSGITITYKSKEIFKQLNNGSYGGVSSMGDYENLQIATSTNQREKMLIAYVQSITADFFDTNSEKIIQEYSDVYEGLVNRLRYTMCYGEKKEDCPKITIKSPYWYSIVIQGGYISSEWYVHKTTGITIKDMTPRAVETGKSGLYVLSKNDYVSTDPYRLYLLRNDGSRVLQFQASATGTTTLTSFELLPNKKIQLRGENINQIISVKLK